MFYRFLSFICILLHDLGIFACNEKFFYCFCLFLQLILQNFDSNLSLSFWILTHSFVFFIYSTEWQIHHIDLRRSIIYSRMVSSYFSHTMTLMPINKAQVNWPKTFNYVSHYHKIVSRFLKKAIKFILYRIDQLRYYCWLSCKLILI